MSAVRMLLISTLVGAGWMVGRPAAVAAQAAPVEPGARVRATAPGGVPRVGRLIRMDRDSAWILPEGAKDPTAVPLSGAGLEVRRVRTKAGTGALIGGLVGIGATAFFLSQFCGGDTSCGADEFGRAYAVFGLPPLAVGFAIGAASRSERWERVPVPHGLTVHLRGGRVGLGVAFRW